jgi:flagellar assembly protein FliH
MATRQPPRQVPPPERRSGDERRTNYSRFIPREELSDFSSWSPSAFQDVPPAERPGIFAPAPQPEAKPAEPPPPPEPSIDELLHAARQSGYQDGYRDGMAALDAFKQSFAQQMSKQIGALVKSFDTEFAALEEQMADTLATMAVELARQVVRAEIEQRPETITRVAHDAVEALQLSARHVRVRVNPEDLALVQDGAGEEMKARDAQIIPDAEVPRGGCKVDSDLGSVDATLATRWLQVVQAMGQTSLWEDRRAGSEDGSEDAPS